MPQGRSTLRPASRGALFFGPSSMEDPRNVQVRLTSLEPKASGPRRGRMGPCSREQAIPPRPVIPPSRGNLMVFLDAFKADGGLPRASWVRDGAERLLTMRGEIPLLIVDKGLRPHPEEAASRRVSRRIEPRSQGRRVSIDALRTIRLIDHCLCTPPKSVFSIRSLSA